jgi:hypothetical protein
MDYLFQLALVNPKVRELRTFTVIINLACAKFIFPDCIALQI